MDMYGSISTSPDCLRIDDLLDFSNHPLTTADSDHHHLPPPQHPFTHQFSDDSNFFTNFPSIPSEEAAELEWLSQFVDDTTSFHDFPPNNTMPMGSSHATSSFLNTNDISNKNNNSKSPVTGKSRSKREANGIGEGGVQRCSHCGSEKTPQWRTGPLGPKTLCNACGVRFKSGRLVPEYRPAASPTFMLTQHSNSHRKVMELRRQKELLRQQQH